MVVLPDGFELNASEPNGERLKRLEERLASDRFSACGRESGCLIRGMVGCMNRRPEFEGN